MRSRKLILLNCLILITIFLQKKNSLKQIFEKLVIYECVWLRATTEPEAL